MEDYPRQKYALLTVIAVEESYIEVTDADRKQYRVRCIRRQKEPLRPGDVLIVNQAIPAEGLTVVERLNTQGRRDGCQYELADSQLASTAEPA
jgi:hypothetical protein